MTDQTHAPQIPVSFAQARTYVVTPALSGRDRYLGGDYCPISKKLYFIPGSARQVMSIDPLTNEVALIGPELAGKFKWLRSVRCPITGHLFGIPSCASQILCIEPDEDLAQSRVSVFAELGLQKWKYHGAVYSALDQAIYALPCNASQVLRIDPLTRTTDFIGPKLQDKLQWYGGLLGADGCIYGMPNCASQVIKINPRTQEVSFFGDFPQGQYQWHGGVVGHDGCFYAVPSHARQVLKIDPVHETTRLIGADIDPGLHRPQGRYKYGGAVVGPDGAIYCLPSDADRVLKIDPVTEQVQAIGPAFALHNKWQNGYLAADGCIYAIPCNSESVLKIDCATDEVSLVPIDPVASEGFEKWEGGCVDGQGHLWCVPQNSKVVLKIVPGAADACR